MVIKMSEIEERVLLAQENTKELDKLLQDYLPFIKKQLVGKTYMGVEYDDMLSLAMLSFVISIRQYKIGHGSFLSFCAACIKNRLIDESRKQLRYNHIITPFDPISDNSALSSYEEKISITIYNDDLEHQFLSQEIDALSLELKNYDITLLNLPTICPKQKRAREQCIEIAKKLISDSFALKKFSTNHKIPQTYLAHLCSLSPKTIEKHRKYILTITIILLGDYPCIKAFLP